MKHLWIQTDHDLGLIRPLRDDARMLSINSDICYLDDLYTWLVPGLVFNYHIHTINFVNFNYFICAILRFFLCVSY